MIVGISVAVYLFVGGIFIGIVWRGRRAKGEEIARDEFWASLLLWPLIIAIKFGWLLASGVSKIFR